MAIGLARMFGVKLPANFNSPYKSSSIIDFWRRWHMTLSRFLRDYLYFPLGGNRKGTARRYLNLMLTMLLGGLWHGAGWTYVAWGGLHGLYLLVNHAWRNLTKVELPVFPAWAMTMLAVIPAWVFFRASDFASAANIVEGMFGLHGAGTPVPGVRKGVGVILAAICLLARRSCPTRSKSCDASRRCSDRSSAARAFPKPRLRAFATNGRARRRRDLGRRALLLGHDRVSLLPV